MHILHVSGVGKKSKQIFIEYVNAIYITKGKFISFPCKYLYVRSCLLCLSSAQQFRLFHQSDKKPVAVQCLDHITEADILLASLYYF
jgi:hypothetical protein